MPTIDCSNCGRPFVPAKHLFTHGQIYCSSFCRFQSYITPVFKVTRECANCHAIFVPLRKGEQKVCHECYKKHGSNVLKPIFNECQIPSCGRTFKASVHQERFCRTPPCPSALFGKNRKNKIKTSYTTTEHLDKKAACKRVICDVMDVYFKDVLALRPITTIERLKEIKNEILAGHCDEHVNRKGLAAAVFYITSGISQAESSKLFGVTEVTLRKYKAWWNHDIPVPPGEKRKPRLKSTDLTLHGVERGKMERQKRGRPPTGLKINAPFRVKGVCDGCMTLARLFKVPVDGDGGFRWYCERCRGTIYK